MRLHQFMVTNRFGQTFDEAHGAKNIVEVSSVDSAVMLKICQQVMGSATTTHDWPTQQMMYSITSFKCSRRSVLF